MTNEILILTKKVKFKTLESLNNIYRKDKVRNITLKLGKVQNWQSS